VDTLKHLPVSFVALAVLAVVLAMQLVRRRQLPL
jgi:hypothetical protein